MRSDLSRLISQVHDASLAPEAWPEALKSLTNVVGTAGAAYIVYNNGTGRVEWVCLSGLSAEVQSDYIRQYAALDPYLPMLDETWTKLSECLPESILRRTEWYNDFVLRCGVRDILGTRLADTTSHSVVFGLHLQIGRTFAERTASVLNLISGPLKQAARRHTVQLWSSKGEALDDPRTERSRVGATYHFHIRNGREYPDETGSRFRTPGEAIAHAAMLAGELAQEEGWDGFSIHVANERGEEIARAPIRP